MHEPTKECLRCGQVKPTTAFSKHRGRKDGLQAYCKECYKAANKAILTRNAQREVIVAPESKACGLCGAVQPIGEFYSDPRRPDGHYAACKTCHRDITDRWKAAHRDDVRRYDRVSRLRHIDRRKAWERAYRKANAERIAERARAYKLANRARASAREAVRRGRKANAPGDATPEQIAARWAYYGGKCWICRTADAQHTDHVKPLAKGGSNWPANLRPACAACNLAKNDRWPFAA